MLAKRLLKRLQLIAAYVLDPQASTHFAVYTASVQRFVRYLQQQGVIRATADAKIKANSPLSEFRDWLLRHRGLALITVARHERLIMQMLPALGSNTAQYSAAPGSPLNGLRSAAFTYRAAVNCLTGEAICPTYRAMAQA